LGVGRLFSVLGLGGEFSCFLRFGSEEDVDFRGVEKIHTGDGGDVAGGSNGVAVIESDSSLAETIDAVGIIGFEVVKNTSFVDCMIFTPVKAEDYFLIE